MPRSGFVALIPVAPGRLEELERVLLSWGNDVLLEDEGGLKPDAFVDFRDQQFIHFMRFALLKVDNEQRLLITADFDLEIHDFLEFLRRKTTCPDAIWGLCVGWRKEIDFSLWFLNFVVVPEATYIAFPGVTLQRVNQAVALFKFRDEVLSGRFSPRRQGITEAARILVRVDCLFRAAFFIRNAAKSAYRTIGLLFSRKLDLSRQEMRLLWEGGRRVASSLNRVWWIRAFNILSRNPAPVAVPIWSSARPPFHRLTSFAGYPAEDSVFQNQLTLLTSFPAAEEARLRGVLRSIDLYARGLAFPGSLLGIATIHTVRWTILPDCHGVPGRIWLLMTSNYDGSWDSYISEFCARIFSGLDAIWGCAEGAPPAGARDIPAFKEFLRTRQIPAAVFYSAYKGGSVSFTRMALTLRPVNRLIAGLVG